MSEWIHPQTEAFWLFFPKSDPEMDGSCKLSKVLGEFLQHKDMPRIPVCFVSVSTDKPAYSREDAKKWGMDYSVLVSARFKTLDQEAQDISVLLGQVPCPDDDGEFIINGQSYYLPCFLRTPAQLMKLNQSILTDWGFPAGEPIRWEIKDGVEVRDARALYVLLIDKILVTQTKERVSARISRTKDKTLPEDPRSALSRMLSHILMKDRRHSLVHEIISGDPPGGCGKLLGSRNPLEKLGKQYELSFYGPYGGVDSDSLKDFALRDVHAADFLRICPVETPQGHRVGLNIHLARRAFIEMNVRAILSPSDPKPGDSLGHAASLVPFIEHNDVNRALMGANMMKQALPLTRPECPWIRTGWEKEIGRNCVLESEYKRNGELALGTNLLTAYLVWGLDTFEDGIVISDEAARSLVAIQKKTFWFDQYSDGRRKKERLAVEVTGKTPFFHRFQNPIPESGVVAPKTFVQPGDVLVSAIEKRYEDEHKSHAQDVLLPDGSIVRPLPEVRDCSLYLRNFRGIVVDIIDSDITPAPKLPQGVKRRIGVVIESRRKSGVGDKITGRAGNKGVIVKILPAHEMPYLKVEPGTNCCKNPECKDREPHRHVQVILNPLGVLGRLNIGQLYETALGKVAEKKGSSIEVRPFSGKFNPQVLADTLESNGFSADGKEQLYTFNEGKEHRLRYRALTGPQYFVRLPHIAQDKLAGRGMEEYFGYSLRDSQPQRGKRLVGGQLIKGAQRVGEMEGWALAGHGAWDLLDDFFNIKSDDRARRESPETMETVRRPEAFANLIVLLRAMGFDLRLLYKNPCEKTEADRTRDYLECEEGVLFNEVALSLVKNLNSWNLKEELLEEHLSTEYILTSTSESRSIGRKIELEYSIVHPFAFYFIWDIMSHEGVISAQPDSDAGSYRSSTVVDLIEGGYNWPSNFTTPQQGKDQARILELNAFLDLCREKGWKPKDFLLKTLAVLPSSFYSAELFSRMGAGTQAREVSSDLVELYKAILIANKKLEYLIQKKCDENALVVLKCRESLYHCVKRLFYGGIDRNRNRRGLLHLLEGKRGLMRGHLAGKRADYSGRAVIVGDPRLGLDEIGIPHELWEELGLPNNKNARPIILANRQPSLHRYSFQSFFALRYKDKSFSAVALNPFVCAPFNADYDGDTIAIHVPRKGAALSEACRLLPSFNLTSQANGDLVLGFEKDIALAAALLSFHESGDDNRVPLVNDEELFFDDLDIFKPITVGGIETTIGRLLLKRLFGPNIQIENRCMENSALNRLIGKITKEEPERIPRFLQEMSRLFDMVLRDSGLSISVHDISQSKSHVCDYPFLDLAKKAGKYETNQERQLLERRGRMRRPHELGFPSKKLLALKPVEVSSCLVEGHPEMDYLLSAHGARCGLVDRGIITAYSGELMRQWIFRLQDLYIVADDCGGTAGTLSIDGMDFEQLVGLRYDSSGNLIQDPEASRSFRTPLFCEAKDRSGRPGICKKCYGLDPATGKHPVVGLPVGILAAQALAERVTQLTMRTFHTGGAKETNLPGQSDKRGLELVNYLKKALEGPITHHSQLLKEILDFFPRVSPPRLVHFEVLLRGFMSCTGQPNLLSRLVQSQMDKNLLMLAVERMSDDLYGVLSRIVSGSFLETGPKETIDDKE